MNASGGEIEIDFYCPPRLYRCFKPCGDVSGAACLKCVFSGLEIAEYIVTRCVGNGGEARAEDSYDAARHVFAALGVEHVAAYVCVGCLTVLC